MTNINPIHYKIHLEPNLATFKVDGVTEIEIEIKDLTSEIVLNTHKLAIWGCALEDSGKYKALSFSILPEKEEIKIKKESA